jgi:hypothetical protein
MRYEPLSEDLFELRTLTIHPLEEGVNYDALMHCTLDHIRLDTVATEGNHAHGMRIAREGSNRS